MLANSLPSTEQLGCLTPDQLVSDLTSAVTQFAKLLLKHTSETEMAKQQLERAVRTQCRPIGVLRGWLACLRM